MENDISPVYEEWIHTFGDAWIGFEQRAANTLSLLANHFHRCGASMSRGNSSYLGHVSLAFLSS